MPETPQPELIPRNCGACKHFDTEFERGYYGDTANFARCALKYWEVNLNWDTVADLRNGMRTARTCPDFTYED